MERNEQCQWVKKPMGMNFLGYARNSYLSLFGSAASKVDERLNTIAAPAELITRSSLHAAEQRPLLI
jgi:hypothetical protein